MANPSWNKGHLRAGLKKGVIAPFVWRSSRVFRRHGLQTTDAFFGFALLDAGSPVDALTRALRRSDQGVTEIAVHVAAEGANCPQAVASWRANLRALLEVHAGSVPRACGVEMTSFGVAMRRQ